MTNTREEVALLPCPFCGGAGLLDYNSGNENYDKSWSGKCAKCLVKTKTFFGSNTWCTKKEQDLEAQNNAIKAWNTRAASNSKYVAGLVEALKRIANPTDSTYGNPQFIAQQALNNLPPELIK